MKLVAWEFGKLAIITWNDIFVSYQSVTDFMIEEGNFAFVRRKIHENSRDGDDTESSNEAPVF